jgi:hypothetical protein
MGHVNLSWSYHRSQTRRICKRKWFFQYASRNEPFERKAELLKELSSPQIEVGNLVQNAIEAELFHFKTKGESVDLSELIDTASARFSEIIANSPRSVEAMHRNVKPTSKSVAFSSDFYGQPLDQKLLDRCQKSIGTCLNNWWKSEVRAQVLASHQADWQHLKKPGNTAKDYNEWKLEGFKIYSPLDFYFKQGTFLHILDWKTGRPKNHSEQLSVYALFASQKLKIPLEQITVQAVELLIDAPSIPRPINASELQSTRDMIIREVEDERSLMQVEESNRGPIYHASITDYPATPHPGKCSNCNFRLICPESKNGSLATI